MWIPLITINWTWIQWICNKYLLIVEKHVAKYAPIKKYSWSICKTCCRNKTVIQTRKPVSKEQYCKIRIIRISYKHRLCINNWPPMSTKSSTFWLPQGPLSNTDQPRLGYGYVIISTLCMSIIAHTCLNSAAMYLNRRWSQHRDDLIHPTILRECNYLSMHWSWR